VWASGDPNYDPDKDPTLHPGPTITAPRLLDRNKYPQARAQQDAFESSFDPTMGQTGPNWHNPYKSEEQRNSDQKYFTETLPELFGSVVEMETDVIEFAFSFGVGGMVNQTGKTFVTQGVKRQLAKKLVSSGLKNTVTRTKSVLGHIFRNSKGHVNPSTIASQNRYIQLFENVANNIKNLNPNVLSNFQRAAGNFQGFSQTFRNGQQIWVEVLDGKIINAGINLIPK
jgi:hypothetical protein